MESIAILALLLIASNSYAVPMDGDYSKKLQEILKAALAQSRKDHSGNGPLPKTDNIRVDPKMDTSGHPFSLPELNRGVGEKIAHGGEVRHDGKSRQKVPKVSEELLRSVLHKLRTMDNGPAVPHVMRAGRLGHLGTKHTTFSFHNTIPGPFTVPDGKGDGPFTVPDGNSVRVFTVPGGDGGALTVPGGDGGALTVPGGDGGALTVPGGDGGALTVPGGDGGALTVPGGDGGAFTVHDPPAITVEG